MSAQVGDVITTAEELDALPVGAVVLCNGVGLARQNSDVIRWSYTVGSGGYSHTADLLITARPHGVTIAYLPGAPPRPERAVKAEALREAAATWQTGGWAEDMPHGVSRPALILGMAQRATDWLRARADEIEATR